jgi:DNA-binding FadR family transcriptional regulator
LKRLNRQSGSEKSLVEEGAAINAATPTQPTLKTWRGSVIERTLDVQVAREIGVRILAGELPVGSVLPNESLLGLDLGVSRTVLREAIKVLEAKGLVEVRRKTGTRIRPRSDWNALDPDILRWLFAGPGFIPGISDLLELRLIIEPAGAHRAAARRTAADLQEISNALHGMEATRENAEATVDADLRFHLAILEATHNAFMRPFGALIQEALCASFRLTNKDRHAYECSIERHRAVYLAIEARNPEAAKEAMRVVLNKTSEDIQRAIADKAVKREF